ncbi:hypothetical protein WA556_001295 [Blastocystis sp. ATCC 50177/Nand II]
MRTAVMLTKCGHSFCSYCIRQSLYKEQICPLCRKPATESDIVRNVSVNDIADAFREHRGELLSFCNQMYSPIQANRTSDDHEVDKPKTEEKVPSKESTPVKEAHGLDTTNSVLSDTTDSSYEFEDDPPQKRFKKTIKTLMVECPICHDFFDQNIIEVHASTCDGAEQTKPAKPFTGFVADAVSSKAPLPNLCYRLMKTSEIKKQLQKCNLPTNGSRDALIERHRQFTLRFNAELDHDNPMPAWKIAQIVISNEEKTKNMKR